MANKHQPDLTKTTLPSVGFLRLKSFLPFTGLCAESWRQRCVTGRAPQPIRLSSRCTVYRAEVFHAWLADPIGYRATPETQKAA